METSATGYWSMDFFANTRPDAVAASRPKVTWIVPSSSRITFIQTNIVGTFTLLKPRAFMFATQPGRAFHLHHVSTDGVYGSLGSRDPAFREVSPYAPNSPYAAAKAASDHLVRAYHHTHGLPVTMSNCFPGNTGLTSSRRKLIPLVIVNAARGQAFANLR